jgi:hypothetical protein
MQTCIHTHTHTHIQQEGEVRDLALPPGWETRATAQGRIFYVNNKTKTTQWAHPLAPEDLPPNWTTAVDEEGRLCYMETVGRQTAEGLTEYARVYQKPGEMALLQNSRAQTVKIMNEISECMNVPFGNRELLPERMREIQDMRDDVVMDAARRRDADGVDAFSGRFMSFFKGRERLEWPHGTCKLSDRPTLRRTLNQQLVMAEPWRGGDHVFAEHHVLMGEIPLMEGIMMVRDLTPDR